MMGDYKYKCTKCNKIIKKSYKIYWCPYCFNVSSAIFKKLKVK
uniref:DNA-directed RNA polymerase subunit P n=1 Tax=viral metagenome TaxID=1070528 RepID=A0A6M3LV49_9ZZZZ